MKIVVLSYDNNSETFEPFHHCMEKYWPNHPEIVYFTESVKNPYYKTISIPHTLDTWTKSVREFLNQIDDTQILWMMDDIFIRDFVDTERIGYALEHLNGNIANFNFEKSWDVNDEETDLTGFKKRKHGSRYEVSIMCGLWDKDKLLKVLSNDTTPWQVEYDQNNCNFDYYINSGDYIINWGYKSWEPVGIMKGKWSKETIEFFNKEGIKIDYTKKGIM